MPQIRRPQISRVLRELLPHRAWTPAALLAWFGETRARNARAKDSHYKRRLRRQREREALPCAA